MCLLVSTTVSMIFLFHVITCIVCSSFQADSQVFRACCLFVDNHSKDIVDKNLRRNFLMHLVNLQDFDLINGGQIQHVMNKLNQAIKENNLE